MNSQASYTFTVGAKSIEQEFGDCATHSRACWFSSLAFGANYGTTILLHKFHIFAPSCIFCQSLNFLYNINIILKRMMMERIRELILEFED